MFRPLRATASESGLSTRPASGAARKIPRVVACALAAGTIAATSRSQEEPTALYGCLLNRAADLTARSMLETPTAAEWLRDLPEKRRRWLEMLGLDPLPPRTELHATVTGSLNRDSYVVEKLHFQPIPGCRIAANLYRPAQTTGRLPAVVYVCGHSQRGKFHYQPHARWFGQHGYVALILDAIQIGENGGVHHGTHTRGWWHWISQGYSPVGVEVWAAMRAADYLQSRPDVDPDRLGITGNSGGGTVSWFTGAADPRFRVVAPSCQTGNLYQHVRDRTIDGHCDCTYWVNTYGWDFTDVATLIAPRPLMVAAATEDVLFRPYAFRDLVGRVRPLYLRLGAQENVALVEAITPHGYSPATRLAIFSWFERHLKGSDKPVTDDIIETGERDEDLAVYPNQKPPEGDRLNAVDTLLITAPKPPDVHDRAAWQEHQSRSLAQLRKVSFRQIPANCAAPSRIACRREGETKTHRFLTFEFESEPGMPIRARLAAPAADARPRVILIAAMQPDSRTPFCARGAGNEGTRPEAAAFACVEVRGTGASSLGPGLEWTARRAYPIIGQTFYERKTLDLLAAVRVLRQETGARIAVYGRGAEAAVAIYAALLDPEISEIVVQDPALTHWDGGPEFLGVLKTGDLPHNLALAFPRPITIIGAMPKEYEWARSCYAVCGEGGRFRALKRLADWTPAPDAK